MKFELDEQTLGDLGIYQNGYDGNSILQLFNKTITFGGTDKLRDIFSNPLTDADAINERIAAIKYLQNIDAGFEIDKGCDFIEFYLTQRNKPQSISPIRAIEKRIVYYFKGNNDYYVIQSGIRYTLQVLAMLRSFTENNAIENLPRVLQGFHQTISNTLSDPDFNFLKKINPDKIGAVEQAKADVLLRYSGFERLKVLLDIVYQLDVFISVGERSIALGFTCPKVIAATQHLKIEGIFHPSINNPVANDIEFNTDNNVCFVTGTNMAGKSTLLKALGICVFLSQLGFPVPAAKMETSVFNGLITTINLADNITQGSSHFYSEVLRVKHVARKIAEHQNVFVIFDELFRGTNVKDAYDASLAIITALAKIRSSFFVISTHIVEVAHELRTIENINFRFMETLFDKGTPTYSYELKSGITEERLGMWIVKNEGIIEIIERITGEKVKG
jgi:DNA mismatch repair protein MutS